MSPYIAEMCLIDEFHLIRSTNPLTDIDIVLYSPKLNQMQILFFK